MRGGLDGGNELIGALRRHKDQYRYVLRSELVFRLKEQFDANPFFPLTGTYRWIVVDEYQDLNMCDVAVINAITFAHGATLYVAGDDDQSIYQQLRHAHPQAIRDFVAEHGAADLRLATCVRCDGQILDLATSVIRQEVNREPKALVPHESAGPGILEAVAFPTGGDEALGIARIVQKFREAGVAAQEILILLRSDHRGAFSGPIKSALDDLRLPSVVRTPERSPLDTASGRQLLGLLRLTLDDRDDLAWRTVLEAEALGVGEKGIAALHDLAATRAGMSFSGAIAVGEGNPLLLGRYGTTLARATAVIRGRLADLAADNPSGNATVAEAIMAAAALLPASGALEGAVGELLGLVTLWSPPSLEDFLGGLALRKEEEADFAPNTINIMTVHKAKGLDACVVILAAAEEELFPGRGHTDEERRLLYVSLTRAKHALLITHANRRHGQQARAGIGGRRHQRTRFLDGTGLVSRPGLAFVREYAPVPGLLSSITPTLRENAGSASCASREGGRAKRESR